MLSVSNRRLLAIELTVKGASKHHIKKRLRGSVGGSPKPQTMKEKLQQQDRKIDAAIDGILVLVVLISIMFADNLF